VDYTSIAGGAGGSIKLSGNSIKIASQSFTNGDFQFDVSGGASSPLMGAGGGGKVILDCRTSLANENECLTVDNNSLNLNTDSGSVIDPLSTN
jgi:hypothetical protein